MACEPIEAPGDIDLNALRERYRRERDKRVRTGGAQQYLEVRGGLAKYFEGDPHTPPAAREPVSEMVDVVVVGGGFAGLLAGARLKEAGVTSIRHIDTAGDFGGVWYWNRYPGVQCDNDACCYLPLLEEVNYVPKEKYSYGPEIFAHSQRIGRHYGLYEGALFGTSINALVWDDAANRWRVGTDRGDDIQARFVIMATGSHHRPKLPGIPGLESFTGHSFHTSRWDYDYTGGDTNGDLRKLTDKRVAIIGTGATAIQCVPHLGRYAEQLFVFQRTPSTVDARGNKPTDPEWVKTLKPGWQAERQRNFQSGAIEGYGPGEEDLICDGWTELNRTLSEKLAAKGRDVSLEERLAVREVEDFRIMERLRRRVDSIVTDAPTADALKAWYRVGCKRPCYNDGYLPTFNRSNVTLVDVSDAKGVERITPKGLVAGGREYEVDCIVYASGFEFTGEIRRSLGIDTITGRNGKSLYDHWRDGYRTLHGITTHGFPNQFFTGFTQGALGANITLMYDQQAKHIAYIISQTLSRGGAVVEPTLAAQEDWVNTIRKNAVPNTEFWRECTPGHYNSEGEEVIRAPFAELYGPGFHAFDRLLEAWRKDGGMQGLAVHAEADLVA